MNFRKPYTDHVHFSSPIGAPTRQTYTRKVSADGIKSLEKSGAENLYQRIQVAAKGVLVADLMLRSLQGDSTAILPSEGVITDLTTMPTSLLEAHAKIMKARDVYGSLPKEVKLEFGNSFEGFMTAVQNGTFTKDYKLERKTSSPSAIEKIQSSVDNLAAILGGAKNE